MGRNTCSKAISVVCVTLLGLPAIASAVPFFGPNVPLFDPEIDVVNSGVVLDAQATVSADRKYVTLGMRQQSTQLLAIRDFEFQTGFPDRFAGQGGNGGNGILDQQGMTLLNPGTP